MRAIELFAGAGGLGMGVSKAGFSPELVVEWDKWCCDTLRHNRANRNSPLDGWPSPVEADVRYVDYSSFQGRIDLVTGGPPCQPFSLGGKHGAHLDPRDMWSEAVRAVRTVRPLAFIFENVKGLTRNSFATYLAYIERQLNYPELTAKVDEPWMDHLGRLERFHSGRGVEIDLAYNVSYRVLNAADYGVPQKRERIVFVGFRADLGMKWSFPEITHSRDSLNHDQGSKGEYWDRHRVATIHRRVAQSRPMSKNSYSSKLLPWLTIRDALLGLPDPEFNPDLAVHHLNHRFQPGARQYAGHTGSPLDEPAKTLKAGVHGVPGGENMLVRLDGSVRYFSVRESARLQTFPDQFALHGSWSEAMRQLGNAVPVRLAEVVARDVFRTLTTAEI